MGQRYGYPHIPQAPAGRWGSVAGSGQQYVVEVRYPPRRRDACPKNKATKS